MKKKKNKAETQVGEHLVHSGTQVPPSGQRSPRY